MHKSDTPLTDCEHDWVANSGQGGKPIFKTHRIMSRKPIMHVKCSLCNARTWFTETQWQTSAEKEDKP